MLKIGVLGAGHLGKVHLKCIGLTENIYDLVGFFDPDADNAREVSQTFGLKAFPDIASLLDAVDVVDIVSPTSVHYELAAEAIKRGKHVFVEKPLAQSAEQASPSSSLPSSHRSLPCRAPSPQRPVRARQSAAQ